MEQINLSRLEFSDQIDFNSYLHWCVISLIAQKGNDAFNLSQLRQRRPPKTTVSIELKLEGVEVSFVELIRRIHAGFANQVECAVKSFISDKTSDQLHAFGCSLNELQNKLEQMVEQAGQKLFEQGPNNAGK